MKGYPSFSNVEMRGFIFEKRKYGIELLMDLHR